jgi:hypothetical protein
MQEVFVLRCRNKQLLERPHMICDSRFRRRRDPKAPMDPAEILMREVQDLSVSQVTLFL